ncbi:MAG: cytochrome c oxidase subunit III [Hymenobacter sp.]|nr:MAG: cytochrome c oxidase subunit III [Hymenobacter sp.]
MEQMPPRLLMLYVGLLGIGMLFMVLIALYVGTRLQHGDTPTGLSFPRYFSLSTIVLVVSSVVMGKASRLYRADDLPNLARCLGAVLLLASIFCGLQLAGWRELTRMHVLFKDQPSGSYIYFISGVHIVHIVAGMGYLLWLLLRTVHASRDGVRTLVFIRNPYRRRQLQAITTYWHFVDIVWVVLFAVFLLMY